MIKIYKNKKWLENKYINNKLSISKIAMLCNVSCRTIWTWLNKYDIPRRSKIIASHLVRGNHCNLSEEAIEWINGEMLGDGNLRVSSSYSARFGYGSKYPEYIKYVSDTLKSFGIKQSGKISERYHKNMNCYSYHYCSLSYVELLPICKKWYPQGKKIVPKELGLTPLTCRQWYIGDGSLMHGERGRPRIRLNTHGFKIVDVNWLIKKLDKLRFKSKRQPLRNVIGISTESTKQFLNYIGECPVNCYQYKWAY